MERGLKDRDKVGEGRRYEGWECTRVRTTHAGTARVRCSLGLETLELATEGSLRVVCTRSILPKTPAQAHTDTEAPRHTWPKEVERQTHTQHTDTQGDSHTHTQELMLTHPHTHTHTRRLTHKCLGTLQHTHSGTYAQTHTHRHTVMPRNTHRGPYSDTHLHTHRH